MKTLDDKKIKEIKYRVKNYITDGAIKTKQKKEYTKFFLMKERSNKYSNINSESC